MHQLIPWRVKHFISKKTPVLYYLVNNLIHRKNSEYDWDEALAMQWDNVGRTWPNRVDQIQEISRPDDRILDVACGTGSILRMLYQRRYRNLFGLEHSATAVDWLSKSGITMRQGSLPKIDFEDDRFDVVIASEVLEHILFHKAFLREIVRVLKPGGQAMIYVPNDCMGPVDEPSHVRTYNQDSLRTLLGRFGEVVAVDIVEEDHFEATFLCGRFKKNV